MKKWYKITTRVFQSFNYKEDIFFGTEEELLKEYGLSSKERVKYDFLYRGENSLQLLGPEGYETLQELEVKLWGMNPQAEAILRQANANKKEKIQNQVATQKKESLGDLLRKEFSKILK